MELTRFRRVFPFLRCNLREVLISDADRSSAVGAPFGGERRHADLLEYLKYNYAPTAVDLRDLVTAVRIGSQD
jgi:hypothetical protein